MVLDRELQGRQFGALIGPDLVLTAAHAPMEQATYRVVAVDRSFRPLTLKASRGGSSEFVPGDAAGGRRPRHPEARACLGADLRRSTSQTLHGSGPRERAGGIWEFREGQKRSARVLRRTTLVSLGPIQVMNCVVVVADGERAWRKPPAQVPAGAILRPILAATGTGLQLLGVVSWSSGAVTCEHARGGLTAVTPVSDHVRWIVEGWLRSTSSPAHPHGPARA